MPDRTIPEICVFLPVYNGSAFLYEAIQSVLAQTYREFRFIIVDDGSTDDSAQIVSKYNDARIEFIQREHIGMDGQLNWVLQNIESPYIAMMEQDNILDAHRLEFQHRAITENRNIDVISSSYIIIDAMGQKKETHWLPTDDANIRELFPVFCPIAFGSVIIRRDSVIRAGGFRSETFPNNDYDLWLRMLPFALFSNVEQPLLFKRRHKNAATVVAGEQAIKQRMIISSQYLAREMEKCTDRNGRDILMFKLALCHYYNGSMNEARKIFYTLIRRPPGFLRFWRYFIVSLLGDTFMKQLRKKGLAMRITNILRKQYHRGKYLTP
jgi:glycosyltransferase involved in cell wall biosynthesis